MTMLQRTVLIVDDSAEDSHTFRRYLERERGITYTCYAASTVAEGLELCRSMRPDVILLDYRMPDDSGLAFLAALIAEHGPLTFAVVMLTGSGDEAVAVQALKLGAQDYLVKEHTIQQRLAQAIDNAISKVQLQRQIEQQRHDLADSNQQLRQALEAQQASAAQLGMALQAARMATWEWDLSTNQLSWDEGLDTLLGRPAGELGNSFGMLHQLVHPDEHALVRQRLEQALRGDVPYEVEFRTRQPDGSLRWIATRGSVMRDAQGTPIRMIGIDMDVSARKQAEIELLRSEAQFKTLVEHATDVIARFDRALRHLYVSPAIERASGIAPASYIGKTNRELGMDEQLCQIWETQLRSVFATGHEAVLEFVLHSPEGLLYFQSTLIAELSADGTVDTVMSIAHDVTVYKQAEARMRFLAEASKALATSLDYHTILDQMARLAIPQLGDACMLDVVGEQQDTRTVVITHTDREQEALLRELCSQPPISWSDTPLVARVLHSGQPVLLNERPQEISAIYAGADHQQALIQQLAPRSLLMLPFVVRGTTIGVLALYATRALRHYTHDDLALAEELVRRAAMALDNAQLYQEAQEAIREREAFLLVASHEVKNPLTALFGRAQMLQRKLARRADSARELEDIGTIIDQSNRINRLLSELLDVSQLDRGQFRIAPLPLNLGDLLRYVVAQIQPFAPNHRISIIEQATMLAITGDANRLEQVFQNLISNAIKYSPAGGAITIKIAMQDARARITVSDEGLGIPAAALPHVFKRFYRVAGTATQPIGGSGIGLYVVKEIVTGHGGTVEASSTEGIGSSFMVYLPLALVQDCAQSAIR